MAIVESPALSLQASGSIGAITFSRWRGRAVAKSKPTASTSNTALQQTVRANMATLAGTWSTILTPAQRLLWDDIARQLTRYDRLRRPHSPLGYALYVEVNMNRYQQGVAITAYPPDMSPLFAMSGFTVTYEALLVCMQFELIDIDPSNEPPGYQIWIAGPYNSAARHALDNEFRFKFNKAPAVQHDYYGLTASKYFWARCRWISRTGVNGNWFESQFYTG